MSPHELLEAALLDACGLLEPHESAEFERAFAASSEPVRAAIRREQARFADLTEVLPAVSPRAELRQMVIRSVMEAAGTARDEAATRVIAHQPSADVRPSGRRSFSLWRVSTFGFATAAVVMTVLAVQLRSEFDRVQQQIASNEATQFFLSNAPNAEFRSAVLSPVFDRVSLVSSDASTAETEASVFFDPQTGRAHLGLYKLPPLAVGEAYTIVQLDDAGAIIRTVERFVPTGEIGSVRFAFDPSNGTSFAIARQAGDSITVVMTVA